MASKDFSLARKPKKRNIELPEIPEPVQGQRDLVRFANTPFYHTPNEPADPQDCNRYPNSIYCTNFWDAIDREQFIGFNTDLVLDECNIGVQVEPVLGFIRLPPTQLVYRHSPCPPPKKPYIPQDDYTSLPYVRDNGRPLIGYYSYSYAKKEVVGEEVENPYFEEGEIFVDLVETVEGSYPGKSGNNPSSIPNMKLTFAVSLRVEFNGTAAKRTRISLTPGATPFKDIWREKGGTISGNPDDDDSYWTLNISGEIYQYISYPNMTRGITEYSSLQLELNKHEFGNLLIRRFLNLRMTGGLLFIASGKGYDPVSGFPYDFKETRTQDAFPFDGTQTTVIVDAQKTEWLSPGYIPEIPTPPRKKKDEDMNCCKNNDQLLRLLLKRVGNFPVRVPSSYLTIEDKQPTERPINSLMELTAWFAERFDEVIGEFEIKVEIDDADLTKEGQQRKTIRLPNLAETVGELFAMQFQQTIYTDLIVHLLTNVLVESGQIKQMDFKNHHALMAITEYMGFPYKNISQKLPLTFTPGEGTFEQLLKESNSDVSVIDYVEKGSMAQDIHTLLQAAAIIRAVFYRRAPNDKEALKQQLLEDISGLVGERTGGMIDIIKEYMKDLNNQYDATEDSEPS